MYLLDRFEKGYFSHITNFNYLRLRQLHKSPHLALINLILTPKKLKLNIRIDTYPDYTYPELRFLDYD